MASSSFDTTSSYPISLQTPQSDWELQLSQILAGLGQQQLNWANNVFDQTSAVTDSMINNYMNTSQMGLGLAANNIDRYENLFQPQENALVQDANTYASTARKQMAMGAAESATGQAMDQGRLNAEQKLRDAGIDPSSGRYGELEQAQAAAKAAAQAGAGQQAELATEATGRELRNQAIQVGQQYPGQAVNELNSAYQGISGAEGAALGNANTGANLMHTADPYFSDAMNLKYPPVGNVSSGFRTSSSSDPSNSGSRSSSSNGSSQPTGLPGGLGASNGGGGEGGGYGDNTNDFGDPANSGMSAGGGAWKGGGFGITNLGQPTDNAPYPGSAPSGDTTYEDAGPGGYYTADNGMLSMGSAVNNSSDMFGSDMGSNYDPYSGGGGSSDAPFVSSGSDVSDSSDMFAQGGVIPSYAGGGGYIPHSMSPSGGRQTDDIPATIAPSGQSARLNAGEFVIPKDVAHWKGQEFFQKLIEDSRRKRTGAPAKGKMKPALPSQQHAGMQ